MICQTPEPVRNVSEMKSPQARYHEGSSKRTLVFETCCVLTAYGLILLHLYRISNHFSLWHWDCLFAILLGWLAADLASGVVHWLADTWGSESMPWLGPRFLTPFRVHHVTPHSFLECKFMDTNGDTAMIGIPFLLSILILPIATATGFWWTIFATAFCAFAIPTNQIHQWAHMPHPPRWVSWLQQSGLILSSSAHRKHHSGEHAQNYCITTGFCNRILDRIRFFRFLEWCVTRATGFQPREDEQVKSL